MDTIEKKKQTAQKTKNSNFYQKQYQDEFVDQWDDLINWDGRTEGEGDFFIPF